jgi:hypothetical protein
MNATRRTWRNRLVAVVALWLVIWLVLAWFDFEPHPGRIAVLVVAAAMTWWLFLDATAASLPPHWESPEDEPLRRRGSDPRLDLYERVVSQHLDSRDATDLLHRYLAAIADERLVGKHGLSRRADPARAAELLGPQVTEFLERPHGRRLSLSQIDQLLSRIEAL